MLYNKQNKSDHWVVIPLRDEAHAIFIEEFKRNVPQTTNNDFNYYIKEVAKFAGIDQLIKFSHKKGNRDVIIVKPKYEWITSHTCRRSFCTNEFLAGTPVEKVVEYYRLQELEAEVFNLAFGDWDEYNHRINDLSISNNADREKVLATVAATVADFIKDHPHAFIIATGSTLARTRLYQMGIVKIWDEIKQQFEIQGYVNDTWRPFQKGVNYKAFLLKAR